MDTEKYLQEIDRVIAEGPYKDTWDSLSAYQVPNWYKKLKFGIFIHWGIYSVPAFGSEWYSRNMYIEGDSCFEHHIKTYGPHKDFGYKDFIPMFKAEKFDPEAWAELFKKAGAKYVIPVAEHHDGFQMYDSEVSEWNAAKMGPKRNVLGELKQAVEKRGMILGASSHRVEHWFFMGHGKLFDSDIKEPLKRGDFYWPAMKEPENHHDLFAVPTPNAEFLDDWLIRCCELVDKYQPRIIYFDWWIQEAAVKPYLRKFAAYFYNKSREWSPEGVVINYKHEAMQFGCGVPDIERGQLAEAKPFFWQTDTAIAKNSWCYTENNDFKTPGEIIRSMVDIVCKNGTLLLNVGPKADGTISDEDTHVLLTIGKWMDINGVAIYDSKPWRISAEGPTKIVEGQFADGNTLAFTPEDIRYTVKGDSIYATVMVWPEDGEVHLKELAVRDASKLPLFHGIIKSVSVLGCDKEVGYERNETALHVTAKDLGDRVDTTLPVVIRIEVE